MNVPSLQAFGGYALSVMLLIVLLQDARAAVPEVALATDPMTSLRCASDPVGALVLAGATLSASSISKTGSYLYQAAFNTATWSGSLKKFQLVFDDGREVIRMASVADWDAADILTGSSTLEAKPVAEARHIYTAAIAPDKSLVTMPFLWSELPSAHQAMLNASPLNALDDQLGEKRLDYLRGNRSYEQGKPGGIFRARDRILGAIVHAGPVFVGAPSASLQGSDYQSFYDANKARKSAVYAGAADGMLHAFDGATGEELFAYIPLSLFHRLGLLTVPDASYRPYVDGPIAVAEARLGNQWKSVLVAGMGAGAQGVFALDVTRPDQFQQGLGALWEFTDMDDADIGQVVSAPLILKFKVSVKKGVSSYRYFAVVSGGVNNYLNDGAGKFNVHAENALFLLALDKGKSEKWIAGVNYFKFIMPISDRNSANGLMAPSATLAADGAVRNIYAGDLQGNLWRLDFSGNFPWSNALGSAPFKPLFTAIDEQGNRQPITQKAQLVFASEEQYMVLFGTGKFLEGSDLDSSHFRTQSFYGILDTADGRPVARSQLAERKLLAADADGKTLKISDVYAADSASRAAGWYVDFMDSNKSGERSISSAQVIDGTLFFNTLIPNADPCKKHGGRSYALNPLSGMAINANVSANITMNPAGSGVLSTLMIIAIVPDQIAPRDASGKRQVKKKLGRLDPAAVAEEAAPAQKNVVEITTKSGRLSWREIVNWTELRTSVGKK